MTRTRPRSRQSRKAGPRGRNTADSRTTASVIRGCRSRHGRHRPFEARVECCGRCPGILYLVPEPELPYRRLTDAIEDRWPETPPFGGQFDEAIPHLTIAQVRNRATCLAVDNIARDTDSTRSRSCRLPVRTGSTQRPADRRKGLRQAHWPSHRVRGDNRPHDRVVRWPVHLP
ncbi:2'-5' RNA ligase family protein [Streptomyces sviceus]|uniref:2'-5' RNA ligase family protein n=1 Tax=Streptomyces sviceus TaxID=285530 RepID=UPI0036AB6CC2